MIAVGGLGYYTFTVKDDRRVGRILGVYLAICTIFTIAFLFLGMGWNIGAVIGICVVFLMNAVRSELGRWERPRSSLSLDIWKLSEDLRPIYLLELRLGNEVADVTELWGPECPLAVTFKHPLHFAEINDEIDLAPWVEYRENWDTHYPLEEGYFCGKMHHAVSGPMRPGRRRPV